MWIDEEKTAFNARAKASMREYLRSKNWVEKVESIARMNAAGKIAREAMAKTLARMAAESREELEVQATTKAKTDVLAMPE